MSKIPLLRPYFDKEELEEIQKVLESGWVSQGPKVEEFEKKVAEYLGIPYVVAVNNCTAALHLSLLSVGITESDEVLVADYTFPATAHAVLYCRARPVFVDVNRGTYNIEPSRIEEKITEKTKAIIPVHTFGQPAEMDEIIEISEKHNLKIVEDAACAFGARYKKRYAGTLGDLGCFSLHARKGITTGEGGLVVTREREVAEKVRRLSVFGSTSAWAREKRDEFTVPTFTELGYNYKLSDINAAVGVAQLKKLEPIIQRKRVLARHWDSVLEGVGGITPPVTSEHVTHVYQSYVALVDAGIPRDQLVTLLLKRGIQAQIGTYACHIQPVYSSKDVCPVSLDVYRRALALPMYYTLKEEEIDRAGHHLKNALEELR